jgi:hypothetical protein
MLCPGKWCRQDRCPSGPRRPLRLRETFHSPAARPTPATRVRRARCRLLDPSRAAPARRRSRRGARADRRTRRRCARPRARRRSACPRAARRSGRRRRRPRARSGPFVPAHTTVISTLGGSASMIASRFNSEPTRTSSALPVAAMIAGVPLVVQSTSSAPSPRRVPRASCHGRSRGSGGSLARPPGAGPGRAGTRRARRCRSRGRGESRPRAPRRSWIPRAARRRRPPSRRAGPPRG